MRCPAATFAHPLVVGDRLDTDIAGANAAGLPSLLVLSGVSTADETVRAAVGERPDYIAADLRSLYEPRRHPARRATPGLAHRDRRGGRDRPQRRQ